MATKAKGLRGVHVFLWIAGFFAVTISLDTLFVVWALQSFPGEQVKNSYVLGLDYNREVARRRAQEQLGWAAEVGLAPADGGRLVVRMQTADQSPLGGLAVSASVHISGQARAETVELAEASAGEYSAPVNAPSNARLDMRISARRAHEDKTTFIASKTLVMP